MWGVCTTTRRRGARRCGEVGVQQHQQRPTPRAECHGIPGDLPTKWFRLCRKRCLLLRLGASRRSLSSERNVFYADVEYRWVYIQETRRGGGRQLLAFVSS